MGANMNKILRIALIGSRELEVNPKYANEIQLCYKVSMRLAQLGVIFTSGLCAKGMDAIAQRAYSEALELKYVTPEHFEVYVGSQYDIDRSTLPNKHLSIIRNQTLIEQTEFIASQVHPAWERCNKWARTMHSRNCHQILGFNLDNPVGAVVCWTPNGKVQGGTATAIKIALNNNIPVFNLGRVDKASEMIKIKDFLTSHNILIDTK